MSTTKQKPIYLSDLHFEHKAWVNELTFHKEEVDTFENRIAEVAKRNTQDEMRAKLESFQNRFIREKEVIDILLHDVNQHEHGLAAYAEEHPVAIDHKHFDDHAELRDRMDTFRKLFTELKKEFYRFVAKWM